MFILAHVGDSGSHCVIYLDAGQLNQLLQCVHKFPVAMVTHRCRLEKEKGLPLLISQYSCVPRPPLSGLRRLYDASLRCRRTSLCHNALAFPSRRKIDAPSISVTDSLHKELNVRLGAVWQPGPRTLTLTSRGPRGGRRGRGLAPLLKRPHP